MSGSTCQFCGKPLWRIRRGSDGEFCSREHRNQYKLRMGLSQLAEADKLPGLRRRRDQCNVPALFRAAGHPDVEERRSFPSRGIAGKRPPAVRTGRLGGPPPVLCAATGPASVARGLPASGAPRWAAPPAIASRAALDLRRVVPSRADSPLPAAFRPVRVPAADGGLGRPIFLIARFAPRRAYPKRSAPGRSPGLPDRADVPVVLAGPARGAWPAPRSVERPATPSPPLLPRLSGPSLAASVDFASLVPLSPVAPAPGPSRRSFNGTAPFLRESMYVLPAARWLWISAAGALPARSDLPLARPGPVDIGRERSVARFSGQRTPVGLVVFRRVPAAWTGALAGRGPLAPALPSATAKPAVPIAALAPPSAPRPGPARRPSWLGSTRRPAPGAAAVNSFPQGAGLARSARPATMPYPVHLACPVVSAPAWARKLHEAGGRDTAPAAHSPGPSGRRSAALNVAKDPVFHPRALPLEGELVEPSRDPGAAALEDDFSGGLNLWSGGAASWKLDFAGVRPGAMAFFTPSLGLRNYQLEFLARIERGVLTCALRAAGPDLYQGVRLAAGGLERYAVIDGCPAASVPSALPGIAGGKSLNVRISVCGDAFSAAVNGREVDRWSEARLPSGGVGFASGPEDRVRLYWVKISPGSPEIIEQVSHP